ncbi:MAG: hypothetical protein WCP92_03010 [bacterium]
MIDHEALVHEVCSTTIFSTQDEIFAHVSVIISSLFQRKFIKLDFVENIIHNKITMMAGKYHVKKSLIG